MNSKHLLISIVITLCLAGLYQLNNIGKHDYPEYKLSSGQLAEFDLVAPFDFPILKTEKQIQQEYESGIQNTPKVFSIDSEVEFSASSHLNTLFEYVFAAMETDEFNNVIQQATQSGYDLTPANLNTLNDSQKAKTAFNTLKALLTDVYRVGVYTQISTQELLLESSSGSAKALTARFYSLDQATRYIVSRLASNQAALSLFESNVTMLLMPNLLENKTSLAKAKKEVLNSIDLRTSNVKQGDEIVKKNQILTDEDIQKLYSLSKEYQNRGETRSPVLQFVGFIGLLAYLFVIVMMFNYLAGLHSKTEIGEISGVILLNIGFLVMIGFSILSNDVLHLGITQIPFAMIIISSAVLIGIEFAVLYGVSGTLLMSPFLNWDPLNSTVLLLSTLITIALICRYRSYHDFLKIWLYLYISLFLTNLTIKLQSNTNITIFDDLQVLLRDGGYMLIASAFSTLGCMAIITFFEKKWNRATKQALLELLDFDHPLLKKLATMASGTYHHSLIVGNLAENAAQAIGANPLLARVGSYYHDIGKTAYPDIFTENNQISTELHSKFTPTESAEAIRNHVKEGIALATKYGIPKDVIDIINQHHGTSYIRYFLDVAQRSGEVADLSAFKYPGPLPQSKEAALVMLADIIESTTKAKNDLTDVDLLQIIEDTIQRLIREGQFDESPLTLKDLSMVSAAMYPILGSVYRKRLDYPDEK